jgi:hypothetical protein
VLYEPIEGKTRFSKHEMIASARRYQLAKGHKFLMSETLFDRWIDYGLIGKGEKHRQAYWSLPQMHLFRRHLDDYQTPGVRPIDLCPTTICGWTWIGDESDIHLEQVESVMRTWQRMQHQHPAAKLSRAMANDMVKAFAHRQAEGKRKLIDKMVSIAKNLEFPEPEEEELDSVEDFQEALANVIDPHRKGEQNGPAGAPLGNDQMFDFYRANLRAIKALLGEEPIPKVAWTSARNILVHTEPRYQQAQPQFAQETKNEVAARLYQPRTTDVRRAFACYDLRLILGCILEEPKLCETWNQLEIRSEIIVSPLVLPNGAPYFYLRTHIQRKEQS